MPSDCQCSTACACETKVIREVLSDKEGTKKLRRLETEVENLKMKNVRLERRLKKATVNKKAIVKRLAKQLDRIVKE